MQPIIREMKVTAPFKYLWLKYVTDVDLSVHCAKCLIGNYSKKIVNNLEYLNNCTLSEHKSTYFYLCGVSSPYRWANNFHLAFEYCEGEQIIVKRNGIDIVIDNAKELPIRVVPQNITQNKDFTMCRNWQFAYFLANLRT